MLVRLEDRNPNVLWCYVRRTFAKAQDSFREKGYRWLLLRGEPETLWRHFSQIEKRKIILLMQNIVADLNSNKARNNVKSAQSQRTFWCEIVPMNRCHWVSCALWSQNFTKFLELMWMHIGNFLMCRDETVTTHKTKHSFECANYHLIDSNAKQTSEPLHYSFRDDDDQVRFSTGSSRLKGENIPGISPCFIRGIVLISPGA